MDNVTIEHFTVNQMQLILCSYSSYHSATQVDFSSDSYPDGLKHCSTIAQDIKTCQSLGKKVLIVGGALGAYGFTSDSQATTLLLRYGTSLVEVVTMNGRSMMLLLMVLILTWKTIVKPERWLFGKALRTNFTKD